MAVVPLRHDIAQLIDPHGGMPPTGVHIVEAPTDPTDHTGTEETPDGDLLLTYGSPSPSRKRKDDGFDANLAEDMDDHTLSTLASSLLQQIEADEQSRSEWEETANLVADYLGIKLEDPATTVSADGTVCKAVATCMLEVALKLWGVARAELLPVAGPVKVRRDAPPEPDAGSDEEAAQQPGQTAGPSLGGNVQEKSSATGIGAAFDDLQPQSAPDGDKLALALESDMNHYLTVVDRPYYPDFSKMLMNRALIGLAFRKVYRDPLLRRPVSRWVKAQNLIVNNNVSHLDEGGRVTERIPTSQATMRRLMAAGHYRDIVLVHPTGQTSKTELAVAEAEGVAAASILPGDHEHTVYECYCEIGSGTNSSLIGDLQELEKDETGDVPGYPLPYRVSIDFDSQAILEIRRNWKKGDEDHRPRRRYVKYGFIPGFGFYDWGLIHIVGNPTQAATMIQRATVDAALFANFPGGVFLRGPGGRQQSTVIRPGPGEFLPMDAAGAQKIQDVFMPMPYKEPSAQSFAAASKFESDVKRLGGVIELPVGEGRLGNTPVGTIMSYIESVSQVPGAVHKDDHISQQDEFELLRELFAEDPAALVRGVRRPARQWQVADEIMDPELVPSADPNTPSEVHRLLKVQGMVLLGGLPQFQAVANNRAIYQWAAESLTGDKAEEFTNPPQAQPPAPPDPRIVAAQIKAQSDQTKVQAQAQMEQQKHEERMSELASESQERELDRQSDETRAAMGVEAARIKTQHDTATAAADRGHDTFNQAADRAQLDRHKAIDTQQATLTAGLQAQSQDADRQAAAVKQAPEGE